MLRIGAGFSPLRGTGRRVSAGRRGVSDVRSMHGVVTRSIEPAAVRQRQVVDGLTGLATDRAPVGGGAWELSQRPARTADAARGVYCHSTEAKSVSTRAVLNINRGTGDDE